MKTGDNMIHRWKCHMRGAYARLSQKTFYALDPVRFYQVRGSALLRDQTEDSVGVGALKSLTCLKGEQINPTLTCLAFGD